MGAGSNAAIAAAASQAIAATQQVSLLLSTEFLHYTATTLLCLTQNLHTSHVYHVLQLNTLDLYHFR